MQIYKPPFALALYDFEKTGTSRSTAKISFTLIKGLGDTDNAVFIIEGNQLKTAQFNHDAKDQLSIRVKAN